MQTRKANCSGSADSDTQRRERWETYMNVNVFVDHPGAVDAFNNSSWAGVFEDRSRHVKLLVKRTDDEVAVQHVVTSCVSQS